MIDWLMDQQIVLSVTILMVSSLCLFLMHRLDGTIAYGLWICVPLSLALHNLPLQTQTPIGGFTHYVVGVTKSLPPANMNVMFTVWLSGVALLILWLVMHYVQWARSVGPQCNSAPVAFYSSRATSPLLFGFFKPIILLPNHFHSQYTATQQQLILEHEASHRANRDHWWNALALVILIVFWFNPLVWLGFRQFRRHQELACDQRVLTGKTEQQRISYAKALLYCAEHATSNITLNPTFGAKNTMIQRLKLIKQPSRPNRLIVTAAVIFAMAITTHTALAKLDNRTIDADAINAATPTVRIEPIYPATALETGQEGSVLLQFDITKAGSTANIDVVESSPQGVFDESAITALSQWQFKPRIQGGQRLEQHALLVQLDFRLAPPATQSGD
ncbi:M56 family metallopeptidase [Alteromonas oceanisediminis]|uniref:M56 family metallopeptidase n=1 Tax=Alteromonas oceanisediminis TaxID=2836180 RepID=UPI001BDB2B75|nr:M56 family metallopeptidase [Alteromonas oceanisediminis]MBT0585454.1 TonB family protein [Alteromonas oceanisediminis]